MLTSGNAPFKMTVEIHPDGPHMVLDPVPRSQEQKKHALEFLLTIAANLQLANAQLNQQLIAAQSTNATEKRLREEKEEELRLSQERERSLLKLINDTKSELSEMKEQVGTLQTQVAQLLQREAQVTLREICRVLERHLCLAVAGSKRNARLNYFNFLKVMNNQEMFASLEQNLRKHGFTSSTNFIDRLKDMGDAVVHQGRDCPTLDELRTQLCNDDDEEEERKNADAFLMALQGFGMVTNGRIDISRDPLK